MDDLIVIILTLIVAVVGTIGQIKKKKLAKPEPATDNEQQDVWDLIVDNPEEEVEDQMVLTTDAKPKFVASKPSYSFQTKMEGSSNLNKDFTAQKRIEPIKKEKIKEKFSLRKAVIYSEILNRKYS